MNQLFNPSYIVERSDILSLIPQGVKTVLDVGCSNGTFGQSVKKRFESVKIIGLEANSKMVEIAKEKLDEVRQVNLNEVNLSGLFSDQKFDCIVMGDILEHLVNPWKLVKQASSLLTENGVIITSLPNVRHFSTILSLTFKGGLPYRERGIHDKSHLRFFTRKNILEMFEEAGLKVVKEKRNKRLIEGGSRLNILARYMDWPGLRGFITFQYLHLSRIKHE